jgi:UDP-N-acetylmuramate dehydrogenase
MLYANQSLRAYNTFGLDVWAELFVEISSESQLTDVLGHYRDTPKRVLGGGSNVLLTGDTAGLVLHNQLAGMEVVRTFSKCVWVRIGGGVLWHDLVIWAIDRNLGGIENLALIPGTVGAAPIQNIGAYGVELKDVFVQLEALHLGDASAMRFAAADCAFGYRDSVFKNSLKDKAFITSVVLRLALPGFHKLHLEYGDIQHVLLEDNISKPHIGDVAAAVMEIRRSKLPDPKDIGNAGSFFKNPSITADQFARLRLRYPQMPGYKQPGDLVKVPAGWLIDKAGWKGHRRNQVGCHERQALVLVNYGGATGAEVFALAQDIQADIFERYGIRLDMEVNIW